MSPTQSGHFHTIQRLKEAFFVNVPPPSMCCRIFVTARCDEDTPEVLKRDWRTHERTTPCPSNGRPRLNTRKGNYNRAAQPIKLHFEIGLDIELFNCEDVSNSNRC